MHPDFTIQLVDDRRRDLMDQAARRRAVGGRRWLRWRRPTHDAVVATPYLQLVDPPPPRVGHDDPGHGARVA